MFHSSKHPFDIMFVILCVIAGANSHNISNTRKSSPVNQLPNRFRTSFTDFILDNSLFELLQSANSVNQEVLKRVKHTPSSVKVHITSPNICHLLSAVLNNHQVRFCERHQDLLETVLPQVIHLAKKECARVTSDLRWNCTAMETFFDRSRSLSFTREGAFVRALLNVSMMYLTLKVCEEHSNRLCGCQTDQNQLESLDTNQRLARLSDLASTDSYTNRNHMNEAPAEELELGAGDLKALNAGSTLLLSKTLIRRQGCTPNADFANAFTKAFLDIDDTRSLTRAYRILNEDHKEDYKINRRSFSTKRLVDSDYKDLSFIKWTKSAINLHNNHVGRQLVRKATLRHCRCHGLSGMCQFQTCWNKLPDLSAITSRLRAIYLSEAARVEVRNLGSYDKPDLYLVKSTLTTNFSLNGSNFSTDKMKPINHEVRIPDHERILPSQLIYFYESLDYCEEQHILNHLGTRGRMCTPKNDKTSDTDFSKNDGNDLDETIVAPGGKEPVHVRGPIGSCEHLCCNRGHYGELTLEMVTCNCRFKFCCRLECGQCLRQQVHYYCL